MLGVPDLIDVDSFISGYHDEYLPSVHGGWINGEKVRRQHKKGGCKDLKLHSCPQRDHSLFDRLIGRQHL